MYSVNLIWVGDFGQLPSVEYNNAMQKMIDYSNAYTLKELRNYQHIRLGYDVEFCRYDEQLKKAAERIMESDFTEDYRSLWCDQLIKSRHIAYTNYTCMIVNSIIAEQKRLKRRRKTITIPRLSEDRNSMDTNLFSDALVISVTNNKTLGYLNGQFFTSKASTSIVNLSMMKNLKVDIRKLSS